MNRIYENRPDLAKEFSDTPEGVYSNYAIGKFDKMSNLPKRAWGDLSLDVFAADKEAYEKCNTYLTNIVENVILKGKGMFIYGNAGNGKTTWAYKFATGLMVSLARGRHGNRFPVYYANVPSLMSELKLAFTDDALQARITKAMKEADLVIFDDIGAENSSEWAKEQLYQFINYRYANEKACVFTSNLPDTGLEMRISDRVREMCDIVQFTARSQRGK